MGPALGHVRGKHQLEEADMGEAMTRDDFSQEVGSRITIEWVVVFGTGLLRNVDVLGLYDGELAGPRRLIIVNDETVLRIENEFGFLE